MLFDRMEELRLSFVVRVRSLNKERINLAVIHKKYRHLPHFLLSSNDSNSRALPLFIGCDFCTDNEIFCSTTRKPLFDYFAAFFFQLDLDITKASLFEIVIKGLQLGSPTDSASEAFCRF